MTMIEAFDELFSKIEYNNCTELFFSSYICQFKALFHYFNKDYFYGILPVDDFGANLIDKKIKQLKVGNDEYTYEGFKQYLIDKYQPIMLKHKIERIYDK